MLKLKWPNDLLLGTAKLAGILIEGESDPVFAVAVGIGVNCASHPADTAFPATDLAAGGAAVAPETLFAALARAMAARFREWQGGEGFAGIRAEWLKRAGGLGQPIRVRLGSRELAGRFHGLDEAGRLQLEQPGGVIAVTAGEVFGFGGV